MGTIRLSVMVCVAALLAAAAHEVRVTRIVGDAGSAALDVSHEAAPVCLQTSTNLIDWLQPDGFVTPYPLPVTRAVVTNAPGTDRMFFRYAPCGDGSWLGTNALSGMFHQHDLLRIREADRHAYTWLWLADTDGNTAFDTMGWEAAWHSLSNTVVFLRVAATRGANAEAQVEGRVRFCGIASEVVLAYRIPVGTDWGTVDAPLADAAALGRRASAGGATRPG